MNLPVRMRTRIGILGVLCLFLVVMFAGAMNARLNHDEGQFVAAGWLVGKCGLALYRDFPSFHMPNLAWIYAFLFHWSEPLLVTARSFSVLAGGMSVALVMGMAWRAFGGVEEARRIALTCAAGGVLVFNTVFAYSYPLAWNAALPCALTLAAVACHLRGAAAARSLWYLLSGLLLAFAIGTRLTYAPLALPFLILSAVIPGAGLRQRARCALGFCLGLTLGLVPVAWAAGLAPESFVFHNFIYNSRINSAFRIDVQHISHPVRDKVLFALRTLVHPSNLAVFVGFALLALSPRKLLQSYPRLLVLAIYPFALIGVFAPTPCYTQYFLLPVALSVLGMVFGLAGDFSRLRLRIFACSVVVGVAAGAISYRQAFCLPRDWAALTPRRTGLAMLGHLPAGRVLALDPIPVLEAGLAIYPAFSTGSFAWRTAHLLTAAERARHGFVSEAELPVVLAARPPDALLLNCDKKREVALLDWAMANGYRRIKLKDKKSLWLPPPEAPGDNP